MSIVLALIPLGLVLLAIALWAFFWAVGNGQFDDLESPAWHILLDDDARLEITTENTECTEKSQHSKTCARPARIS